jgi:hypothetical protein
MIFDACRGKKSAKPIGGNKYDKKSYDKYGFIMKRGQNGNDDER